MFWILCAAIGLFAGTLGGLLGVGGGIVMVPAFTRLLGLSVKQAIGTSMGVIFFTAISASWRHWQLGNLNPKVVLVVAVAVHDRAPGRAPASRRASRPARSASSSPCSSSSRRPT